MEMNHVLVVEDDKEIREGVEIYLKSQGYEVFKFAEACGDYYQFTLSRLLNHDIDSDGVSPTEIFGLERDQMEKILNGLSINYPDFINASFTLDLDNITLNSEKTSADVLSLF